MTRKLAIALGVGILTASLGYAQDNRGSDDGNKKVELKVGDKAPQWKLPGSDGKVYALSDFKDKHYVAVAWYPMALTGG